MTPGEVKDLADDELTARLENKDVPTEVVEYLVRHRDETDTIVFLANLFD